jgi:hypothetical protein
LRRQAERQHPDRKEMRNSKETRNLEMDVGRITKQGRNE